MKQSNLTIRPGAIRMLALLLVCSCLCACETRDKTASIEQAKLALLVGEPGTAIVHVHNLLRDEPHNVEARLLRADIALEMDDGALAEKDLLRAQELGVPPGEIAAKLGKAMLLQGAFSRVIADIHTGAADDEDTRTKILLMRGDAYLGLERLDSAEQVFRDVSNTKPDFPNALVGLGRVAFARGNADLALDLLSRAREVAPDDVEILRAYALLHLDAGNLEVAKAAFLEALQLKPIRKRIRQDSFAVISGLFETHMRLGETVEARALALEMLSVAPGHPLVQYLLGEHAWRTGQRQTAAEHLQRTLSALPTHLGALSRLGSLSLEAGKFDLAESYLRQAIAIDEDNAGLRMQLARTMLLRREGDTALDVLAPLMNGEDEAPELLALAGSATRLSTKKIGWLGYFERAAAADPDNPDWQLELARAYLAAGFPEKCFAALATVPKTEEFADSHDRLLLEAYRRSGDLDAAMRIGTQLRARNPGNTRIDLLMGELYLDAGDLPAARAIMDAALEADSTSATTLLYAGKVEVRDANFEEAETYFRSAYTLHPDNLKVVTSIAVLAQRDGNTNEAIEILEAARITNPLSLLPLVGLVSLYLRVDDVKQAYETAQQAIELRPEDPRSLLALGATQIRREEYRQAVESLKQAALLARDSALIRFALAQAYQAAGKPGQALMAVDRAIKLAPRKASYVIAAIELNLTLKRYDEAERLARTLIEADPGNTDAHRLLGEALLARNNFVEAAAAFGAAADARPGEEMVIRQFRALVRAGSDDAGEVLGDWLETYPDSWRVRLTLAGLLHRNDEIEQAVKHYNQVLIVEPDNALVLNNLALAYDILGDERSIEMAERAHELRPHVGAFTDTLGWLLVKNGETVRGSVLLRKAVQQLPSDPVIRYHLAVSLAQNGDVDEARRLLSDLVDSAQPFDGFAEARNLLNEL